MTIDRWEDFLPLNDLMSLHQQEMERRGTRTEIQRQGCIEGALGNAWLAEYYTSSEVPGAMQGFVFSCNALRLLAMDHCVVDGNKRLAWLAFVGGLAALDLSIAASDEEADAFMETIIKEHLDSAAVVAWASDRLVVLGTKPS